MTVLHHRHECDGIYATTEIWVAPAPWAHPIWDNYLVLGMDLQSPISRSFHLYREGVTHEVLVYVVNPNYLMPTPEKFPEMIDNGGILRELLRPIHGYQFIAADSEAGFQKIDAIVGNIETGDLFPTCDRQMWDAMFEGCGAYSLHVSTGELP